MSLTMVQAFTLGRGGGDVTLKTWLTKYQSVYSLYKFRFFYLRCLQPGVRPSQWGYILFSPGIIQLCYNMAGFLNSLYPHGVQIYK